jgi:hypothetical protein
MLFVAVRGGGLPSRFIILEEWNDGIVDEWVFLDRIISQFKY